ncbi:hypothetical protein BDN70DRAFT_900161 [Pholiota conissans]|uniref:Uncharacterized protein n=1 Tax=Pholiota conissans TaxID=109636 RepID=A0A9P5YPE0_9AGAR|nr:hypothetical protein BDN70DRAFT_900161 [Pholiota conissans]
MNGFIPQLVKDTTESDGRLIDSRTAHLVYGAAVFGFPLGRTDEEVASKMVPPFPIPKLFETPEELKERRTEFLKERIEYLKEECAVVWPKDKMCTKICHWDRRTMMVLAVVSCTEPNDEYIPRGFIQQHMVSAMRDGGFEDPPRWFYLRY